MTELSLTECPSQLFKSELGVTDVSFESADGKVFHLQRKYLEMNTGGFPPTEFDTQGSDPVQLTESSVVLEALFRFAYPVTQPDLEDVSFEVIAAVAEAAEKYIVFSAMNFCRLRMRRVLPKHAIEILAYGAKHDYSNVVEEAAPHSARLPLGQVINHLPTGFLIPWIKYHEAWKEPFDLALQFLILSRPSALYPQSPCYPCSATLFALVMELQNLQSLDEVYNALSNPPISARTSSCLALPATCGYSALVKQLTTDITKGIKNIPPFETFFN